MRSTFYTSLLACFILMLTSAVAQAQAPKMEFKNTTHDFGKVKAGEKARHVYKFKNTGDAALKIKDVKTTCGCTVADYPKKKIKPGKKGKIVVEFDTHDKNGPYAKGVNIYYNGGEAHLIILIDVKGVPLQDQMDYPGEGSTQDSDS